MTAPLIQGASGDKGDKLTYASIDENNKEVYTFLANENVTWSITGGEQSFFIIDKDTGKLSFKNAPDYETIDKLNGTTVEFITNYSTANIGDTFYIELYDSDNKTNKSTPITSNNFIQYVNNLSYDKTLIHRLVRDYVIQGGGYKWPAVAFNEPEGHPKNVISKGEIKNEPGNSNLMGTISMAKVAEQPDSATSQWFINLSDNKNLDSSNGGYTVFGHILGDGIKNPLVLNNITTYNVNYLTGLNLAELPLANLSNNIVNSSNYFAIHSIRSVDQRPIQIANKYNLIVSATDSEGNTSNQYVIVDVNDIKGEILYGSSGLDNLKGGIGNDVFQGNSGNDTIDGGSDFDIAKYTGNFSEYSINLHNKLVTIIDKRSSINDGIDTLSNIEKLIFDDKNALVTSKGIKQINPLGFQSEKIYSGKSDTYKFYDLGSDKYGVATSTGIDELTGESLLKFDDKEMNLKKDIKATFDQVTGLNTDSGKMFRLYNAAFARFPDAEGLRYWIGNFSSGKDDERAVASSFLVSPEFENRYGENVTNDIYVQTLYINVLGRDYDQDGYNYWLGNLNSGVETRYELLLGFSESIENKALFSEMTGLY